jgi:hypothetical protein
MGDGEVVQIKHLGLDVKVMMTQEYFFELMGRLEKTEGIAKTSKYDSEQLMSDFEKASNK